MSPSPSSSQALVQASVFRPLIFIAQEPQMPSRHERRSDSVVSISFLIFNRASSTMGPQLAISISKVSMRGRPPDSGSKR
jgi:hypothetical protein